MGAPNLNAIADKVIAQLQDHVRESSWGEDHRQAARELFEDYRPDLVQDVEHVLLHNMFEEGKVAEVLQAMMSTGWLLARDYDKAFEDVTKCLKERGGSRA